MNTVSRRSVLKGLGAVTLGLGLSAAHDMADGRLMARAAGQRMPSAFYRFQLGSTSVTIIQEGTIQFEAGILGINVGVSEVGQLLSDNGFPASGEVKLPFNVMLVETDGKRYLIDTGLADGSATSGDLLPTLALLGLSAEQIDGVVISHFHPDHINGVSDGTQAAFPNAVVYFPQPEFDFMQKSRSDRNVGPTVKAAEAELSFAQKSDRLTLYAPDTEILPGIQALAAYGHTPGHMAFRLESGSDALINVIDAAVHSVVSVQRPDWSPRFDMDAQQAIQTRRAMLDMIADQKLRVFGYHFPFPGTGYIDRAGDGFRFIGAQF